MNAPILARIQTTTSNSAIEIKCGCDVNGRLALGEIPRRYTIFTIQHSTVQAEQHSTAQYVSCENETALAVCDLLSDRVHSQISVQPAAALLQQLLLHPTKFLKVAFGGKE